MKIVITVNDFKPDRGYMEYYLAKELSKIHEIFVFTFSPHKSVFKTLKNEGFNVVSLPSYLTVSGNHIPRWNSLSIITDFLKSQKPNIIHCQPVFSPLSLLFITHPLSKRLKIVGSILTGGPEITRPILEQDTFFKSLKAKISYSAIKLLVNRYIKKRVSSFFAINKGWELIVHSLFDIPREKISVIPFGADQALFKFNSLARGKIRASLGIDEDDIVIVFSGRITPAKNLPDLILALSPLIARNSRVKLLLVGEANSEYLFHITELCKREKISNNVIYHKSVHRKTLPDFYSASDIAVWPGGPSISMVEALAVGLPIILKKSAITNQIIENRNGFAFDHGNLTMLQNYLQTLILDEKLRIEMGGRSRKLVEQKLNWKHIANQYANAYCRVLK